jgi:hypothetical protein
MISTPQFCCEIEIELSRQSLYPNGLNGNAGKNIIRTKEGQKIVSEAVSKAKKGRTKETHVGIARQAEKLMSMVGDNRTDAQKEWDNQKSECNRKNGNHPPSLIIGSKMMNDGCHQTFIRPEDFESYLNSGWRFGRCKSLPPMSEETKQKMRKPKSEEHKTNMSIARKGISLGPARKVVCKICENEFGSTEMSYHVKSCRRKHGI